MDHTAPAPAVGKGPESLGSRECRAPGNGIIRRLSRGLNHEIRSEERGRGTCYEKQYPRKEQVRTPSLAGIVTNVYVNHTARRPITEFYACFRSFRPAAPRPRKPSRTAPGTGTTATARLSNSKAYLVLVSLIASKL